MATAEELANKLLEKYAGKKIKYECFHCKAKIQKNNLQSGIDCGNFKIIPVDGKRVAFHDDCLKRYYYNQTDRSETEPYGSHVCFYCSSKVNSYNLDRCLADKTVIIFESKLFHKRCFDKYKKENTYDFNV